MQKKLVLICLALSVLLTVVYYMREQYHQELDIAMYAGCSLDKAPIEEYQREHPDAAIHIYEDIPAEEYPEWLAEKILAGQEPAIFVVPMEDAGKYIQLGALQQLDMLESANSCHTCQVLGYEKPYCLTIDTTSGPVLLGISPKTKYPKAAAELLLKMQ